MNKKVIAFLLSVVLASGSIIPALAAETTAETAEEAVSVEEGTAEEITEESEELTEETENTETNGATEDVSEGEPAEEIEEEPGQELAEEAEDGETGTTEETETAEDLEEADSADIADTSAEMAEAEEPEIVTEEEVAEAEGKEAALAEGDVVDSGTCGENVTWTLTGTGYDLTLTISGTGEMSEYNSSPSSLLPPWYSKRQRIKTAIIENGVTGIGSSSFYNCSSIMSITIPNSVASIGHDAFYGCSSLTSIMIPNGVTSIGSAAFDNCSSLRSFTIPDSVTSIGDHAFYGCGSLTSITIPNGVTSIEHHAFSRCSNLASIPIPDSVKSIGESAFSDCSKLTDVTIPDGVTSIGLDTFRCCSSLTNITIPDSITSIGQTAFSSCSSLTSITIPGSGASIGSYAFQNCSKLASVTISDGVASIGDHAFYNCGRLASVTISDSVTSIGEFAFNSCSSLMSITIPGSVTTIEDYVFSGCSSLASVSISDSVTSIGDYAFQGCRSLASVTFSDSVTSIGDYAFSYCYKLNSAMIPDSVTSIGDKAFYGCNLLTVLTSNNYVIEFCRLHSIKWLPYIKDVYPEIGAENVDHNSSKLFFIDFCYNVTPNDGYAYLYESGKDDPIERIHISDSETTGYSFVNNGLELMFPIDSLQRGKTYSIAIDKNALRFVDDNWDEVNVDFPGLDKDIWEFTTVDLDYFAFDNPKVTVPLKLYSRFFGVWSPFIKRCEENGSNGLCFGLNYLIGLNELHDGPIGEYLNTAGTTLSGLQKEELKDIKPDGFNESLLEYLQMAFIYQYTSEMQKQAEVNLDKYDKLYEATNSLKTDPITVGFRTKDGSYHAIYPIKRLVDNDAYCEVLVYDSGQHEFSEGSHSGLKTHLEKLRINKDGGECEGATYKGKGCMNITFRVISQSFNGVAGPSYQMCSLITSINNLKASINDLEAKITLIESTIGEDTGIDSDLYLYWLEGKALDVNLSENNTLSIIGEHDEIKGKRLI